MALGKGAKIRCSQVITEAYIKLVTLLMLQYDNNIIITNKNLYKYT